MGFFSRRIHEETFGKSSMEITRLHQHLSGHKDSRPGIQLPRIRSLSFRRPRFGGAQLQEPLWLHTQDVTVSSKRFQLQKHHKDFINLLKMPTHHFITSFSPVFLKYLALAFKIGAPGMVRRRINTFVPGLNFSLVGLRGGRVMHKPRQNRCEHTNTRVPTPTHTRLYTCTPTHTQTHTRLEAEVSHTAAEASTTSPAQVEERTV